jgi:hypothetical protein
MLEKKSKDLNLSDEENDYLKEGKDWRWDHCTKEKRKKWSTKESIWESKTKKKRKFRN